MSRGFRRVLQWGVERGLQSRAGLSRRDFLRRAAGAALAAGAGASALTLGGCATPSRRTTADPRPVIVIGAGLAGLAAAESLARNNIPVLVLEAENRVGGRADTDRTLLPGTPVERGGHLIGENHPHWNRLARRYGLRLAEALYDEGDDALIIGERLYTAEEAVALYHEVDTFAAELIRLARPIPADRPWTASNAQRLDQQSIADLLASVRLSASAQHAIAGLFEGDNGVPPQHASLLAALAMVKGGGLADFFTRSETLVCLEGSDALPTRIANALGDRVRTATPVTHIDLNASIVRTADGNTLPARTIILAIPPTRWAHIEFSPTLPTSLTFQMGQNTKTIALTRQRPWTLAGVSSDLLSDGPLHSTWIAARSQDTTALCLYSGGNAARELSRQRPPDAANAVLNAASIAIHGLPEAVHRTAFYNWPADPRTLGSYCFPAPGQLTTSGPLLAQGISGSHGTRLLFAGEHASTAFPGYMEGALQSGLRAARHAASS